MLPSVLALSAAYVFMAVLLLVMALKAPMDWRWKASMIVIATFFFIHSFFHIKALLGWSGAGPLPERFQLLWARVVEPDQRSGEPGAIFWWIEEMDENNVPVGVPRSFQLPYRKALAEQSMKAREEIMQGNPQEGQAGALDQDQKQGEQTGAGEQDANARNKEGATLADGDMAQRLDLDGVQQSQQMFEFRRMPSPLLPPKRP